MSASSTSIPSIIATVVLPTSTATGNPTTTRPTSTVPPTRAGPTGPGSGLGITLGIGGQQELVVKFNIFIFCCIALWVLFRLPRTIALLLTPSERFRGHFLTYSSKSDNQWMNGRSQYTFPVPARGRLPYHIPSCPALLRPLLTPLRCRFFQGMSGGQILLVVAYFYLMGYACVYRTNFLTDEQRTGWVAVSQMPFVYALAQKNNFLATLLGAGYEKLNFLHRIAGLVCVITANLHALRFGKYFSMVALIRMSNLEYQNFYYQMFQGMPAFLAFIKRPANMWGLVAVLCFNVCFLFSLSIWRNRAYNIFHYTHIIGFVLVLPALHMHKNAIAPWVWTCVGIYVLDRVMRIIKTRTKTAFITPIPELDLVKLEVPSLNAGWRAGQHVRLRVPSSGMGILGWAEVHPFTIASASHGRHGLVLYIKRVGRWTRALYSLAGDASTESGGKGAGKVVSVMIEGPYGGPCTTVMSSFSSALFVCGGSGITFGLAAVSDLILKQANGESRVKSIDLVWTVTTPAALEAFLPELTALIQQSKLVPVRIAVHYTRALVGGQPFVDEKEGFFSPGLTLEPGRPRLSQVLDGSISRALELCRGEQMQGLVVGVCGPLGLADQVATVVNDVRRSRRKQVGGIEVVEE